MVAAGWLYLAANHVNEEARRVSQAYVLDSLAGAFRSLWMVCATDMGSTSICMHSLSTTLCWVQRPQPCPSSCANCEGRCPCWHCLLKSQLHVSNIAVQGCAAAVPCVPCHSNATAATSAHHVCPPAADARKLERLLPMLVALRGRVDSNDPKQCELSDRKAVIHEVRLLLLEQETTAAVATTHGGVLLWVLRCTAAVQLACHTVASKKDRATPY